MRVLFMVAALTVAGPTLSRGSSVRQDPATIEAITVQPNDTGGGGDETVAFGATGANTVHSNSAAGGNASRPERAVPNGRANGGSSGGG